MEEEWYRDSAFAYHKRSLYDERGNFLEYSLYSIPSSDTDLGIHFYDPLEGTLPDWATRTTKYIHLNSSETNTSCYCTYDKDGRPLSYEEYSNGELTFYKTYTYDENGYMTGFNYNGTEYKTQQIQATVPKILN